MDNDVQKLINEMVEGYFQSPTTPEFRIYNKTLCPDIWDANQHLNPEVRQHLLQMAYDFYKKTDFKAPILDIYFMGSSANYNWTPDSDVDVHVLVDLKQLQMPEDTAKSATHAASSLWNAEHEVTVKGHAVEMNIQPLEDTKPHVTGIYSLVKDLWVRKPVRLNLNVDKPSVIQKYTAMKNYIDTAISTNSRMAMKGAKAYVDALRQYGLDTAGELGTENIVFKLLRARGIIKKLKDSITATYDKEMTVTEADKEIGKDYLGTTFMGAVKAVPVKSSAHCTHQTYGMISGVNSQNWRYYRDRNQVLWNEQPIPEDVVKVDDFLSKRGVTNPRHRNLYDRGAGFDTKRGDTGKIAEGDCDALVIDTEGYWNEYSYTSDEAVGPFMIFLDEQKKVHWMFLVNSTADYFLDGKKLITGGGGSNTTHLNMVNRIQPMFPQVMFTRKSGEMVLGRTWKVEGKVYFICWNSDFSLVTIPNVFHYLDLIFKGQCGTTDPNRIFYQTDGGVSVPYEQFKLYGVPPEDDDDDDDDDDDTQEEPTPSPSPPNVSIDIGTKDTEFKDIHTMSPDEKKRELARMGAVPKVPEIPDWMKKQALDIDELVTEIANSAFGVKESYLQGGIGDDYSEIYTEMQEEFARGQRYQTWRLIPSGDILLIWATFTKYGRVDEKKLDKIWNIIKESVIKIIINTEVWNGSDSGFFYKDSFDDVTREEWDRHSLFVADRSDSKWIRNSGEVEGNARYSDHYKRLYQYLEKCYSANSVEELLMGIDLILNFVHGLGAMAKWFVEGGEATLNKIRDLESKGISLKGKLFEVTMKQVGAVHPTPCAPQLPNQKLDYSKMTLANIKSLRDKAGRAWDYCRKHEDMEGCKRASEEFAELHAELKRRLAYINAPMMESKTMDNEMDETVVHSFTTDYGRGENYVEVFRNPNRKEFLECKPHDEVGALLYGRDIYTFNREKAYHKNVMTQTKMTDALSLLLYVDLSNLNRFDIMVTDATRGTQWHHNPKTAGYIQNHPFFRGKQIDSIKYWDEDIVGDWADLENDKLEEGYGTGIPEQDRLHIPDHRWQIRSKDAPKTPKMKADEMTEIIDEVLGKLFSDSKSLILESPKMKTLKQNKTPLTDDERQLVMSADATWHHGPNGEKTPAVWKSVVNGKTWYVCNTHRAMQVKPTLKGAIRSYDFIKTTA